MPKYMVQASYVGEGLKGHTVLVIFSIYMSFWKICDTDMKVQSLRIKFFGNQANK